MKRWRLLSVLAACGFAAVLAASWGLGFMRWAMAGGIGPDEHAWMVFAEASRPSVAPLVNERETPVSWRLWWTKGDVYQVRTGAQPGDTAGAFRPLPCEPEAEQDAQGRSVSVTAPADQCEVVWLNDAAARFVLSNQLWNRNHLRDVIASSDIDFPMDSVEIKTEWAPIKPDQYGRYIVAATQDGATQLRGLVALHVKVHDIPSWTWATFIHVDRLEGFPVHDTFGSPNQEPSGPLLNLLARNKVGVLVNYRLIGTQVNSVPPFLGNPLIEGKSARRSSCLGCHQTALISSVDARPVPKGVSGPPFKLLDFDWTLARNSICTISVKCVGGAQ